MMKKSILMLIVLVMILAGCGTAGEQQQGAQGTSQTGEQKETSQAEQNQESSQTAELILATTTSTQDSGLLDVLVPAFEKAQANKVKVKVVAVGTGEAIKLGKDGNADVLLVHDRKSEDQFVAEGFGTYAYDVMYNQFLLAGPEKDPANVRSAKSVTEAFARIAESKSTFLSRGDNSGTHKKELAIWEAAGIKPEGDWYKSVGQGMGATLQMAEELEAYTLADEATFLTVHKSLQNLFSGDPLLFNQYGVIMVQSTQKPELAKAFIDFIVGKEGQEIIGSFGKEKYGKPLFVPNAKKR